MTIRPDLTRSWLLIEVRAKYLQQREKVNIKVLGAHNLESQHTRFVSLLIDGILALDAGGLTSSLSLSDQQRIKAILLTHHHYDHIRDIPAIAMNAFLNETAINIYANSSVYKALATHFLNGELYPMFFERPPGNPTIRFNAMEHHRAEQILDYSVLATEVNHSVPSYGYQVTSAEGKTVFYTGDTGPDLAGCWEYASPQLLVTELTMPDKYIDAARTALHLTPSLLKQELITFEKLKGYLPSVLLVHMNPESEREIAEEIALVAGELGSSIRLAKEGMQLSL